MRFLGTIVVVVVFIVGIGFLFKHVKKVKDDDIEVLEDDKSLLPKRLLVTPNILLKYIEDCMSSAHKYGITFYYINEEHHISIELENEKYVYAFDGKTYQTMSDITNTALIRNGRIANIHDYFTITRIEDLKTGQEIPLETIDKLKDYVVTGEDKNYNLNLEINYEE